jgi:hypothetical protein
MKALKLFEGTVHTPETLKVIGQAFDDAWAEIAHRFDGDDEKARVRLAHAVLAVAHDNGQNSATLKNAALKVMTLAYGDLPGLK